MTQDKDFSIISVTPDEDDDIVIEAGVAAGAHDASSESAQAEEAHAAGSTDTNVAANSAGTSEASKAAEASADAETTAAAEAAKTTGAAAEDEPLRANPNTMLTTEEDLHAKGPYVGMQRAILVLFLALVVLSIVYWFFIRPASA
ncbi:MAG: hypothetical protein IJ113_06440 [Eggerthellaceae bacterium]|nr:hypothetical protein [Eggerthellaceae bacterium]